VGTPLGIGMAIIRVAVGAGDGCAGGIAAAASAAGVDGKGIASRAGFRADEGSRECAAT
jgi:hypothetical protein